MDVKIYSVLYTNSKNLSKNIACSIKFNLARMKHDVPNHEIFKKRDIYLNNLLMPCLPWKNKLTLREKNQ
jgi:hypothetical protein